MFESVDLPAPFSPSSACTSPSAASKSTPSFATTPGNRFVIPRSLTAAGMRGVGGGSARGSPRSSRLALRAPDDALDEPVHRVEILHAELLALRHAQLPLLVVERPGELVEGAVDQRRTRRRNLRLRRRGDARAERGETDHPVLDRPVVEARLPRPVHRGLDALRVVRPPVVD